jgi:DNA repair protein RadC
MHPREVFKAAVLANAAAIIVGHNHPSGDPTPSPDDVAVYGRLRCAAEVIGIDLLDFVIVGHGTYRSFNEMGR